MSYDSDTVSSRGPALLSEAHRLLSVDPDWLLRWANRRRQSAADVPCARCRHRPVGPGRRQGPAAGRGNSSGLTHSPLYAVGSLGRPPRSLASRTVRSRLPSRPRPMGTARRPRALTVHSESFRCREASRVPQCLSGSDPCCGKDRAVSSRRLRRRTIGPGRGEGRALRFVPPEVPRGPHRQPLSRRCNVPTFSLSVSDGPNVARWIIRTR
jgi:hypothetical protein